MIVGGANLQLRPQWSDCFAAAGMLSPSYRCKFGDNAADGTCEEKVLVLFY